MAKKIVKKITPEYDSQRETRVLLEEINGQVKLVAEQHVAIKEGMDTMKLELQTAIKEGMDAMRSELQTVKMAVMDDSIQIKGVRVGQEEIKQKLNTALDNHEKRISKLEAKVGV